MTAPSRLSSKGMLQVPRGLIKDMLLDRNLAGVLEMLGAFYESVAEVAKKTNKEQVLFTVPRGQYTAWSQRCSFFFRYAASLSLV